MIDAGEAKAKKELSEFYKDVLTPVLAPTLAEVGAAKEAMVAEVRKAHNAAMERTELAEIRTKRKVDAVTEALCIPIEPPDGDAERSAGVVLFELQSAAAEALRRQNDIINMLRVPLEPAVQPHGAPKTPGLILSNIEELSTVTDERLERLELEELAEGLVAATATLMGAPDSPLRKLISDQFGEASEKMSGLEDRLVKLDESIANVETSIRAVAPARPVLDGLQSLNHWSGGQSVAVRVLTEHLAAMQKEHEKDRARMVAGIFTIGLVLVVVLVMVANTLYRTQS